MKSNNWGYLERIGSRTWRNAKPNSKKLSLMLKGGILPLYLVELYILFYEFKKVNPDCAYKKLLIRKSKYPKSKKINRIIEDIQTLCEHFYGVKECMIKECDNKRGLIDVGFEFGE